MNVHIKCKKCRKTLIDEEQCKLLLINAHNLQINLTDNCCNGDSVIYLNEDNLPGWILQRIETEQWLKGRINCLYCDYRIGGFDFVSGLKCNCTEFTVPPVHLSKNKIDLIHKF